MGIDLNSAITYKYASLRSFEKNERHITRLCQDDVLLLVFDGVLRFSEDGIPKEIHAGEYYIQRKNGYQEGLLPSDAPYYFFVHFHGSWCDNRDALAHSGVFDVHRLKELILSLDRASHQGQPYAVQQYLFLKLFLSLRPTDPKDTTAQRIADYIKENVAQLSSLAELCQIFHYSKNYLIRVFRRQFGISPMQYVNELKMKQAMYLLETTSKSIGSIAQECGYSDYPYFYKCFVQKTGYAPLQWRSMVQQNPTHRF